jgi:hypothetical protein
MWVGPPVEHTQCLNETMRSLWRTVLAVCQQERLITATAASDTPRAPLRHSLHHAAPRLQALSRLDTVKTGARQHCWHSTEAHVTAAPAGAEQSHSTSTLSRTAAHPVCLFFSLCARNPDRTKMMRRHNMHTLHSLVYLMRCICGHRCETLMHSSPLVTQQHTNTRPKLLSYTHTQEPAAARRLLRCVCPCITACQLRMYTRSLRQRKAQQQAKDASTSRTSRQVLAHSCSRGYHPLVRYSYSNKSCTLA